MLWNNLSKQHMQLYAQTIYEWKDNRKVNVCDNVFVNQCTGLDNAE